MIDNACAISVYQALSPPPLKRAWGRGYLKPGWTPELSATHNKSKQVYRAWSRADRPRQSDHPLRKWYKKAKANFSVRLRALQREQRDEFYSSLDLNCHNTSKLFRLIRKHNGVTSEPTSTPNYKGCSHSRDKLQEVWADYFGDLASPTRDDDSPDLTFHQSSSKLYSELLASPSSESISFSLDRKKFWKPFNHLKQIRLQGVRQGEVLSPFLYCIFVDELLDILTVSGLGVSISGLYCGAPMYADDLVLVASTPKELQAMLDVVERYASRWRYSLNADKSVVMVLGESSRTRSLARSTRKWTLGAESIKEVDEQHHLGILRTVHSTNIFHTIEKCTSGWSAFFALSSIGSRFGCLHPLTSFRLYNTLCMPILLTVGTE